MRLVALLLLCPFFISAQSTEERLTEILESKKVVVQKIAELDKQIEDLKLKKCIEDLHAIGLPSENYIEHAAMILEYSEEHEQAAWVSHMILPEISDGVAHRSNDFRPDPKVTSGSAVELDYFFKTIKSDSTYEYDGYGYDRGHLAPSADFRWSKKALSQSFYYSNMSPQLPEFNREIWVELESTLRVYVVTNQVPLYIVTMPILSDDLLKQTRAVNALSIPEYYIKVALDLENRRGIAFRIANKEAVNLLPSYALSIDEVEEITGYDFFSKLSNSQSEKTFSKEAWFPELGQGNNEPIYAPSLPRGHFNSVNAAIHAKSGKKITVCGNVVSTRHSKKGNLWLNLDKQYPNQIFSVFVRKEDMVNFSSDIAQILKNQDYCFTGKVELYNQVPTMNVDNEKQLVLFKTK